MTRLPPLRPGFCRLAVLCCLLAVPAMAQTSDPAIPTTTAWAIKEFGTPEYTAPPDHWPYVNPDAPKGGRIVLAAPGQTFDSLNPFVERGIWPRVLGPERDPLMAQSGDEVDAYYGLLAESVEYPADRSWAIFTLREGARFDDGTPITAEDIRLSWQRLTDPTRSRVFIRAYYAAIADAEVLDDRRIRFSFDNPTATMKPITIAAGLSPSSAAYWAERDPYETYLDPEPSSGAYSIDRVDAGRSITFRRNPDYWARDLAMNRGLNNFDVIEYQYYRDDTVAFEAFKAGEIDARQESRALRWVEGYDIPEVADGDIVKLELADGEPKGLRGIFFNQRRPQFADQRVRLALTYLYDFEQIQRTVLAGQYRRIESYFPNSDYAATGAPQGAELALLEPYRGELPQEVFGPIFEPPATDGSGRNRTGRRTALRLFAEAGWEIRDGALVNAETGAPFTIEFLLGSPALERVVQPYVTALRRDGIEASIRIVDAAQYQNRLNVFDYDAVILSYTFYPPPGQLEAERFHSAAAARQGSANIAGISDPVVDALVEAMLSATEYQPLLTATRALDRVLIWGHHAVPEYYNDEVWIAHWNRFGRPERKPKLTDGLESTWWIDPQKDAALGLDR